MRGRELTEIGQSAQPLHHVSLGGEHLLAAKSQPIDQPVYIEVRSAGVERRHTRAVELEEHPNPFASLR